MIRLTRKPTFKFKVELAQPGTDERATLTLVGKAYGQEALKERIEKAKALEGRDAEYLMQFVEDWDPPIGDDDKPVSFSQEAFAKFIDAWPQSGAAIYNAYLRELNANRLKN